jgi:cell division protein FtsI (penicillin-binding protein 3)
VKTAGTARAPVRRRGFERRHRPSSLEPRRAAAATAATPTKRVAIMRVIVLLCFAALAARLAVVQGLSGGRYSAFGNAEVTSTVRLAAPRGTIYDRNGGVLAVSVPTSTVVGDPELITRPAREGAALAPVLGVGAATLTTELSEHSGYVVLARQVGEATTKKVDALRLAGINTLPSSERVDPAGSLAAPVLGAVDAAGAGDSGLEYLDNALLAGRPGTEQVQRTPDDVPLPGAAAGTPATPGTGLELTLDEPLQYVTEQALSAQVAASHAKSGIAVVMDVRTGGILAMANLVADPATGKVHEAPSNLAVTQVYEPGSVFKINTFSAALQDGIITPDKTFTVPPSLTIDGWVFHDAESHPTVQMTATQILAQSSNLGTIEIAQLLGKGRLAAQIAALGFGRDTALHFPGESPGLVNLNPATWSGAAMGSVPIGQDDAVTAQQVLDMVNAVADGGRFVSPRLVRATVAPDGSVRRSPAAPTRRVFSPVVASELTTMMEQVATSGGTAPAAAIPGYAVAGKTGTAQLPSGHGGYIPGAYMATFAGFAPAQDPVLSAVVVLDQPSGIYGGTEAAPVFAQVMGYALHRYGVPTSASGSSSGGATTPLPLGGGPSGTGAGTATIGATAGTTTG